MNKGLLDELKRNLPRFEEEYKNGETLIAMKFIRQDEHGGYLQVYTCNEQTIPCDNVCYRFESLARLISDIKEAS
jgi:hypothetical protein